MSPSPVNATPKLEASTVHEKVLLEKHLPYNPKDNNGPIIELFFHELPSQKNIIQKVIQFWAILPLGLLFLITLPFFALGIKLFTKKPLFQKTLVPGRNGILFPLYSYPIQNVELSKLPSIINILKGQLNLIGPLAYPGEMCKKWNKELSHYYKRFALKPGYWGVAPVITKNDDIETVANSLEKELKYVCNPTLKKDLEYLFRFH